MAVSQPSSVRFYVCLILFMIFESYGSLCAAYPLEKKANRLKALRISCVIRYLGNDLQLSNNVSAS